MGQEVAAKTFSREDRQRYRMKVRMANPNYSPKPEERKDTYPQFAKAKELESEWVEVPQTLVVPPDSMVYAADQRIVEPGIGGVPAHHLRFEGIETAAESNDLDAHLTRRWRTRPDRSGLHIRNPRSRSSGRDRRGRAIR